MRGDNFTAENSYNKCILPRLKTENYNVEIDGRNFYDQALIIQLNNTTKSEKY